MGRKLKNTIKTKQLKQDFNRYKKKWNEETMFHSNPDFIHNNENLKQIIKLGTSVIPLILEDWKKSNLHWFHALSELTGAQPIQYKNRGKIDEMKKDWLNYFIKENRINKLNEILDESNLSKK